MERDGTEVAVEHHSLIVSRVSSVLLAAGTGCMCVHAVLSLTPLSGNRGGRPFANGR